MDERALFRQRSRAVRWIESPCHLGHLRSLRIAWPYSAAPMNLRLPRPDQALPGRDGRCRCPTTHFVNGPRITPPFPAGLEQAVFGMGCFWGAERKFWQAPGVYSTAVGYAGGYTPNPDLQGSVLGHDRAHRGRARRVRSEGHELRRDAEAVLGEPRSRRRACGRATTSARSTGRRSTATSPEQQRAAEASREAYQDRLTAAGYGRITTEIARRAAVLLRRGLSPAVSGEESRRLLRHRRHRRELSDRRRGVQDT